MSIIKNNKECDFPSLILNKEARFVFLKLEHECQGTLELIQYNAQCES